MLFAFLIFTLPFNELEGIETLMKTSPGKAHGILQKAAQSRENRAEAIHLLAVLCNRSGDIEGALNYGEQATRLRPENSDAWLQYAVAMRNKFSQSTWYAMTRSGTYRSVLNKALTLDPHNYAAWHERIAYLLHAPGIAGGGKSKAEKALAELQTLNAGAAHFPKAMMLAAEERHRDALLHFQKAVAFNPHNTSARFGEAFALVNLNRHRKAAACFEAIHREDVGQMSALFEAARTRYLGRFEQEEALVLFDRFIAGCDKTNPVKVADAWYHKGLVHEVLDRKQEAAEAYRACLALDDDFKPAKKALKKLR